MRRILVALATAVALIVIPTAPASVAVSTGTFDQQLRQQANSARKAHDAKPLRFGRCLDRYAQRQANLMAKQRRMFHQNLQPVLKRCKARTVGENVAHGYPSAKANTRAWMKSPGHRHNLLSRKFTRLGIGVAKDKRGHTYTVQVFGRPA